MSCVPPKPDYTLLNLSVKLDIWVVICDTGFTSRRRSKLTKIGDNMNNVCGFEEFEVKNKMELYLEALDTACNQIAELRSIKERLEVKIISELGLAEFDKNGKVISVKHDGEQTQYIGKYKAKVKTPLLWKINKSEYEMTGSILRKEFDPVRTTLTYRVDKKVLDNVQTYGSAEDKELLGNFVTFDFSKPSVTLTLNA